jgi:Protein of unknown function (DUF3352)
MPRKYLAGLLVVVVALGLGGYWFYGQKEAGGPAIMALPPAQTLGFLAVPGLPQAWADLQQSKFFQQVSSPAFWQRALGPEGYKRLIDEKQQIERYLGLPLTEQTVNLLLSREFGLALVPSPEKIVDVIAYVRVSGAERIAESLARTLSGTMQGLTRQTYVVDDIEIVTLHPKDGPPSVSYAFLGTLVVFSTDQSWVIDAIRARHGTAPNRLYTTPPFQAMQLKAAESLLAYGYYDVEMIQAQTMSGLPWAAQPPTAGSLQRLQTIDKVTLKARRADDGIIVDAMALYPPNGATQVFRQAERDGAIPPFPGVPAETFYLMHVDLLDLQGGWQLLKQLAAMGHQEVLQQTLAQFRAWAGVDLERDVLPLLTGVAGLGITAPFGAQRGSLLALPGMFLTLGLTDESKGQRLIQTIVTHAGGPLVSGFLQRLPHNGHLIHYLGNPLLFVKPGYVISRQQLILGSDVSLLQHMLDAAAGKAKTLTDSTAYQDVRKHLRIKGGSITFVDVPMALEKGRDAWMRFGGVIQALTRVGPEAPAVGSMHADPWALLELLRPIRYLGMASQAETQGVRAEAFVAIQDLRK